MHACMHARVRMHVKRSPVRMFRQQAGGPAVCVCVWGGVGWRGGERNHWCRLVVVVGRCPLPDLEVAYSVTTPHGGVCHNTTRWCVEYATLKSGIHAVGGRCEEGMQMDAKRQVALLMDNEQRGG